MSGLKSYCAGLAAEDQVARLYTRRGCTVCARRWRGGGGEIDLVLRDGDAFIFVEVKKARDAARALERVSARQLERIHLAAEEYLGDFPDALSTPARIDVAAVDDAGRIEIVENAYIH